MFQFQEKISKLDRISNLGSPDPGPVSNFSPGFEIVISQGINKFDLKQMCYFESYSKIKYKRPCPQWVVLWYYYYYYYYFADDQVLITQEYEDMEFMV